MPIKSTHLYLPILSVNMDQAPPKKRNRYLALLRARLSHNEGFGAIRGLTNALFETPGAVLIYFPTVTRAHRFKEQLESELSPEVLKTMKIRRRIRRIE